MREVLVHQPEPGGVLTGEHLLAVTLLEPQDFLVRHATHVAPATQKTDAPHRARRVAARDPGWNSRLRGTRRLCPSIRAARSVEGHAGIYGFEIDCLYRNAPPPRLAYRAGGTRR